MGDYGQWKVVCGVTSECYMVLLAVDLSLLKLCLRCV